MAAHTKPKTGGKVGGKTGGKTGKSGKKLSALYEISGDKIIRKNRSCPKCGAGTFLGRHKDRLVCGKCQYMEVVKK